MIKRRFRLGIYKNQKKDSIDYYNNLCNIQTEESRNRLLKKILKLNIEEYKSLQYKQYDNNEDYYFPLEDDYTEEEESELENNNSSELNLFKDHLSKLKFQNHNF